MIRDSEKTPPEASRRSFCESFLPSSLKNTTSKDAEILKGKTDSKRDHATSNIGYGSDDSIISFDSPVKKKPRLTSETATTPQQNLYTFSNSPVEELARLPVTAKTSSLITEKGKCDMEDAGSAISQCVSDAENDIPVASVTARDAEKTPYEILQKRPHKSLTKELDAHVEMMADLATPKLCAFDKLAFNHGAEVIKTILKILDERYAKQQKPPKRKVINGEYPVTKADFLKRLKGTEEALHPWASAKNHPGDFLLRRVTDGSSKARRYHSRGIFSQISNSDFTTRQGRHDSMDKHLDYSNREGTAIISLTGSPEDFIENRIRRQDRRVKPEKGDNRELTYVNTLSLEADGVPVLLAEDEVRYYNVKRAIGQYWIKHEYFVPLRIGVKHIVGTWYWTDVQAYMQKHKLTFYKWEEAIVFPAFRAHEQARKEGRKYISKGGCACCPHGLRAMNASEPRVGADAEKEQ